MKKAIVFTLASMVATVASADVFTFDGGPLGTGTDILTAENWHGDTLPDTLPLSANGHSGTLTDQAVTASSNTMSGMDLTFNGSSSLAGIAGAARRFGGGTWTFNDTSSCDVSGHANTIIGFNSDIEWNWNSTGTFSGATALIHIGRHDTFTAAVTTATQSAGTVSTGGAFEIRNGSSYTLTGGAINAASLTLSAGSLGDANSFAQSGGTVALSGALNINDGTYTISGGTLTATGLSVTGLVDDTQILNFATGSTGLITINDGADTDFESLITSGNITINNASALATDFIITNDTIQLVPEPATLSLLAFGGLVLLRRRRRR